jgi:hypothetical protein
MRRKAERERRGSEHSVWAGRQEKYNEGQVRGGIFLDFPFIEQAHPAEAAKRVSYNTISTARGPDNACRYAATARCAD